MLKKVKTNKTIRNNNMPRTAKVYNQKASAAGEEILPDDLICEKINESLVYQAMVAQMSNERQVLSHTKDRSEVRGGGRKPWRQKGTGRARAGSNRSPIWIGGGVTFGPTKERNFKKKINKKMRIKALAMVLGDKFSSGHMLVLDKLELSEFKTKEASSALDELEKKFKNEKNARRSVLVVADKKNEKAKFSFRNIPGVKIINQENLNILDLLKYRDLLITIDSIRRLAGSAGQEGGKKENK